MSELEDRFVKRGYWVNWHHGPIMGQTFTVEAQTGILVVALFTILASVATAQLWNLLAFFLHQLRADSEPSDGLFWQHQALLRTMPTPTAFMADSLKLSWRWRSKFPHSLLRYSLLISFALCFAIASIAAGVATSYAVDNSNIEVLVDSPLCGRVNYTKMYDGRATSTLMSNLDNSIQTYAMNCYQKSSSLPAPCQNTFHRPNISFTADPAPCPWNSSMCAEGALPAIAMDSGLIDMRTHFGLNVQEKDTVKLRKLTTCNILPREGRIITRDVSYWKTRGFTDNKTTLNYGKYRNTPDDLRPEATFLQSTALTDYQPTFGADAIFSYLLNDISFVGIVPLPEMQRDDADVSVLAVWLNWVMYEQPVNDPFFSAHRPWTYIPGGGYPNYTRYEPDFAAGVIGCAVQYQFCHPRPGKDDFCTKLSGSPLEVSNGDYPEASPLQLSLLQLLRSLTRISSINDGPLSGIVQAGKTVSRGASPGLPDDQWIQEIIGWEALAWTSWQSLLSASVIGPGAFDEYADEYRDVPTNAGDKQLCYSLKMRKAGGFANINLFALVFITTFSIVITLFNMTVLRFAIFLSRFRRALAPRIDRWVQDGIFQLQRRAFEAHHGGLWVDLEKEIPVTKERERLLELPIASLPLQLERTKSFDNEKKFPKDMKEVKEEVTEEKAEKISDQGVEEDFEIGMLGRMDSGLTLRDDYGRMR